MSPPELQVIEHALGQLTPAQKLELVERLARELRSEIAAPPRPARKDAIDNLRRELLALPVQNPSDGFSSRDHDRLLYGEAS